VVVCVCLRACVCDGCRVYGFMYFGCMGVWVYGMGAWVHGCRDVSVYGCNGCMGAWVYGCMGVWVYGVWVWELGS